MGIASHLIARRSIVSQESKGVSLDGDFTALLAALIGVVGLLIWNQVFSPVRFLIYLPLLWLQVAEETALNVAVNADSLLATVALLTTVAYLAISGPAAMRRLIAILTIVTFVVGLSAPFLLKSRENQRMGLGMKRASEMGRALIIQNDEHRGQMQFGR